MVNSNTINKSAEEMFNQLKVELDGARAIGSRRSLAKRPASLKGGARNMARFSEIGENPPAKLFRSFLKTEIENQKRASCDFER